MNRHTPWRLLRCGILLTLVCLLSGCNYTSQPHIWPEISVTETPPDVLNITWVFIEPGKFAMGSDYATSVACKNGEPPERLSIDDSKKAAYCKRYGPDVWFTDEAPVRNVKVNYQYWISDSEVTVAQFRAFVNETNYVTVAERSNSSLGESLTPGELEVFKATQATWRKPWPGAKVRDDHPVVHVAWDDANAFCDWLSKKTNRTIRLPSETEWEYAAKPHLPDYPGSGAYAWGSKDPQQHKVANFADRSFGELYTNWRYPVDAEHDDGFSRLAPVRSYAPNDRGIYDLSGNVWEWTSTPHLPDGQISNNYVMRGGSFDFELPFLRVEKRRSLAFVKKSEAIDSSISVGFRVVTDATR